MRAPATRSFIRLNARSTVVLPLPDEPMKAVISCSRMENETSVTALKALYQIETFFRSKMGAPGARSVCCRAADSGCCRAADSGCGRLVTIFSSDFSTTFLMQISG